MAKTSAEIFPNLGKSSSVMLGGSQPHGGLFLVTMRLRDVQISKRSSKSINYGLIFKRYFCVPAASPANSQYSFSGNTVIFIGDVAIAPGERFLFRDFPSSLADRPWCCNLEGSVASPQAALPAWGVVNGAD